MTMLEVTIGKHAFQEVIHPSSSSFSSSSSFFQERKKSRSIIKYKLAALDNRLGVRSLIERGLDLRAKKRPNAPEMLKEYRHSCTR